ncbi:MAG: flagellar biosynthetic protein FliO [Clostridiales bacterium]|nr:flagellar biosynthetic protein FliO [Clostridiales bacterium]
MIEEIISLFLALIGIALVIVFTYFASKWYARRMLPIAGGRHMKVIDRLVLSKTASIYIIEVQGEQYLVGVSEKNVEILKQLEQPIVIPRTDFETKNLKNLFQTFLHKGKEDDGNNNQW